MGLPQARMTDVGVGTCCCHHDPTCIGMSGVIITSSSNDNSNGLGMARMTDIVLGGCGHIGVLVTGSPSVFGNGLSSSRLTDFFTGCFFGTIVTGSPNVFVGNTYSGFVEGVNFTEVDYGNLDDEEGVDDGYNIYPPVVGTPTPEQIQRSADLSVAPVRTEADDTSDPPVSAGDTPPTTCIALPSLPPPDSFALTSNFTLGGLTTEPVISTYPIRTQAGFTMEDLVCNLQAWAEYIGEPLLSKYGSSMIITSGFRWGNGGSQHERGQAVDIQFTGFTNEQYYNASLWIRDNLQYDQLILEYGGNRPWIHISFNRSSGNRVSTAGNKFGTRISAGNYVWRELRYMI